MVAFVIYFHGVAGGFQCGHLQLGRVVSDNVLFSFALMISFLGRRVDL